MPESSYCVCPVRSNAVVILQHNPAGYLRSYGERISMPSLSWPIIDFIRLVGGRRLDFPYLGYLFLLGRSISG